MTHRPYLFECKILPLFCRCVTRLISVEYKRGSKLAYMGLILVVLTSVRVMSALLSRYMGLVEATWGYDLDLRIRRGKMSEMTTMMPTTMRRGTTFGPP